jgi:uncharacterized protein YkwD
MKSMLSLLLVIPSILIAMPVDPQPSAFPEGNYMNFDWDTFENWSTAREKIDENHVDYGLLQAAIFFYTNQFRVSKHLKPLAYQPNLCQASQYHTHQMGEKGFYDHINRRDRDMRTAFDRARNFGFLGGAIGENIALEFLLNYKAEANYWHETTPNGIKYYYGDSGSNKGYIPAHTYLSLGKAIVSAWINSPGHRANMLNKEFKFLGVGVYLEPETQGNTNIPRIFAAQLFGG